MNLITLLKCVILFAIVLPSKNCTSGEVSCIVSGTALAVSCITAGGAIGGTVFCPDRTLPETCVGPAFVGMAIGFGVATVVIPVMGIGVMGLMYAYNRLHLICACK